jgi:hypothetical protein
MTTQAFADTLRTAADLDEWLADERQQVNLPVFVGKSGHQAVFGIDEDDCLVFHITAGLGKDFARAQLQQLSTLLESTGLGAWFSEQISAGNDACVLKSSGSNSTSALRPLLRRVRLDRPLYVWDPVAQRREATTVTWPGAVYVAIPDAVRVSCANLVTGHIRGILQI